MRGRDEPRSAGNVTTFYCVECLTVVRRVLAGFSPEALVGDACEACRDKLRRELDELRRDAWERGREFPAVGGDLRQRLWDRKRREEEATT